MSEFSQALGSGDVEFVRSVVQKMMYDAQEKFVEEVVDKLTMQLVKEDLFNDDIGRVFILFVDGYKQKSG